MKHADDRTTRVRGDAAQRADRAEPKVPLAQLRRGDRGRWVPSGLDRDEAELLEAMGLRQNVPIRVCRPGRPCIVQLHDRCHAGCRIALGRELASRVMVAPIDT